MAAEGEDGNPPAGDEAEEVAPDGPKEPDGPEVLPTGLRLPLAEKDITEVWAMGEDLEGQKLLLQTRLRDTESMAGLDPESFRCEVIVEFFLHLLIQCKAICLTARKAAVFAAIMDVVLNSMKRFSKSSTRPGETNTSVETFNEYQDLLLTHSVDRPPEKMEVFLGSEARLLTDYVSITFFKQYLLYQYCLVFPREVETIRVEVFVDEPLQPPKLRTAKLIMEAPKAKAKAKARIGKAAAATQPGGYLDKTKPPGDREPPGEGEGPGVDPKIEALLDSKIANVAEQLDSRLEAREAKFLETLGSVKK